MEEIKEGRLTFTFPEGTEPSQYDGWSFYRDHFNSSFGGAKAVDLICIDADQLWLIEIKDYRANERTKPIDIGDEIAFKVRDTLAGLAAARCNANDNNEKRLANKALMTNRLRVKGVVDNLSNRY